MSQTPQVETPAQSMHEAEQALAGGLYQFGVALNENLAVSDFHSRHQAVRQALDSLVAQPVFNRFSDRFLLDKHSRDLLALAYVIAIEPDVAAPFLKTTWYEQGPSISVFRALSMLEQNEIPKSMSSFVQSGLIEWELLQIDSTANVGIHPLVITQQVIDVLSANTTTKRVQALNCVRLDADPSPVLASSYHALFEAAAQGINQLTCSDEYERLPFIQALANHQRQADCLIVDFPTVPTEIELKRTLRNIALAYDFPVVYWPKGLYFAQRFTALSNVLNAWQQLNIGMLICDDPQEHVGEGEPDSVLPFSTGVTKLNVEPIDVSQRAVIWRQVTQSSKGALTQADALWLAQLYPLSLNQIRHVAQQVLAQSQSVGSSELLCKTLQQACIKSYQSKHQDLATLAQPKSGWDDMVLPEQLKSQLMELMQRIRYRGVLQTQIRGFRPGVQALFWGKPGTGKSMAAEAMAAELMLPLYKVNLANIASKWIGESEKHLAKLFDQAERQHAVLLFDEADAIFAKRSEVSSSHDKNANMGVSFLLQRMENYSGLLLLSTNFKNNLDEAFLRRFHSVIEFAMPNNEAKQHLWQSAWQGPTYLSKDIDLTLLAESFEFSPAQIANIAELSVLYTLTENQSVVDEAILSRAILRELDKHSAGYLAAQKVNQWRTRQAQSVSQ